MQKISVSVFFVLLFFLKTGFAQTSTPVERISIWSGNNRIIDTIQGARSLNFRLERDSLAEIEVYYNVTFSQSNKPVWSIQGKAGSVDISPAVANARHGDLLLVELSTGTMVVNGKKKMFKIEKRVFPLIMN